jgi:hypothetical protein
MRAAFAALWATVGGRFRERTGSLLGVGDCKTAGTDRLHLVMTRGRETEHRGRIGRDGLRVESCMGFWRVGKMFLFWSC